LQYTKTAKHLFYGLLFFLSVFLSGCVAHNGGGEFEPLPDIARKTELTTVPFFDQGDDLCGPASISMLLNYQGEALTPQALEPLIYIPGKKGALQAEMLAVTRRHEFIPYIIRPDLTALVQEVNAGNPVLILQNLAFSWYPRWHYAVVVGYDLDRDTFILRSGITERLEMPRRRFFRHWRGSSHWGMVALRADKIPQTAEMNQYLATVASLERLGQWDSVTAAYETAAKKWPRSDIARLGAGNGHYRRGNKKKARDYYSMAINLNPDSAIAHNNLAQTLYDLGQIERAREHALEAIALGGPATSTFRQTLEQINSARSR